MDIKEEGKQNFDCTPLFIIAGGCHCLDVSPMTTFSLLINPIPLMLPTFPSVETPTPPSFDDNLSLARNGVHFDRNKTYIPQTTL